MEGKAAYHGYINNFLRCQYPKGNIPLWVFRALSAADVELDQDLQFQSEKTVDDSSSRMEE